MRTETGTEPGVRGWVSLTVLVLPVFAVAADASSLVIVLPALSAGLGASSTEQLWIADILNFMLAGFMVVMGGFGDWVGQRRLLLAGAAVYAATSFLAAFAPSVPVLIVARAVMGVAGSAVMALSLGLIGITFRGRRQRGMAIAARTCAMLAGAAAGPPLGGFVAERLWWGGVFLLNVPVMLAVLLTGRSLLPDRRVTGAPRPDFGGAVLAVASVLVTVYGIKEIARYGPALPSGAAIVLGVAGIVAFFVRQRRSAHPLLDHRVLRDRSVAVVSVTMLLSGMVLGGAAFFVPLFLQLVLGFSAAQAGLLLVPAVLLTIVASVVSARLIARYPSKTLLLLSLGCAMAGCLAFCLARDPGSLVAVYVGYGLVSFGITPVMILGTNVIMSAVPPHRTGMAASIVTTNGSFGSALGLAVLGAVGSAAYRISLALPGSIPPGAAAAARDGISGAVASAARLPPADARPLLAAAHLSFLRAIEVVGLTGLCLCGVCAVLVAAIFDGGGRHTPAQASGGTHAGGLSTGPGTERSA